MARLGDSTPIPMCSGIFQTSICDAPWHSTLTQPLRWFHPSGMLDSVATAPTKAINRFADFGADLTDTFNHKLSGVYGDDALRTLSSMVLLEASRAIDPDLNTHSRPRRCLTF